VHEMETNIKDILKGNRIGMIEPKIAKERDNYFSLNSKSITGSKSYDYYLNHGMYLRD